MPSAPWGALEVPSRLVHSPLRNAVLEKDRQLRRELRDVVESAGQELLRRHKLVVRTWRDKPTFVMETKVEPGLIAVEIRPKGRGIAARKWRWVDQGTKGPYVIRPKKRGRLLRFRTGYVAKTRPIAKVTAGGGRYTGGWVSKLEVMHPGVRARKFTETFDRDIRPEFRRQVEKVIRRALRR